MKGTRLTIKPGILFLSHDFLVLLSMHSSQEIRQIASVRLFKGLVIDVKTSPKMKSLNLTAEAPKGKTLFLKVLRIALLKVK